MKELEIKELENINGGGWLSDIENMLNNTIGSGGPGIGDFYVYPNNLDK